MTHHASTSVVATIGLVAFMAAQVASGASPSDSVIYLDSNSDELQTLDGSSWSLAYKTIADAVQRMNDLWGEGKGVTLRVAKGVYCVSGVSTIDNGAFRVEGGYRASADGDLTRDVELYRTTITGLTAANWKNATWGRRQPNCEIGGAPLGYTDTDTKSKIFNEDGSLAPFPSYVGSYDCLYPRSTGKVGAFTVGATGGGTFDGLTYLGFGRGNDAPMLLGGTGSVVTNCTLMGSETYAMIRANSGHDLIVGCRFLYNQTQYGATAGINISGGTVVRDCEFIGCSRFGSTSSGALCFLGNGRNVTVSRCRVTRCVNISATASTLLGSGDFVFEDLVVTNNYLATKDSTGTSVAALVGANLNGVIYGGGQMNRCLIAGNRVEVRPAAGKSYFLLGMQVPEWGTVSSVYQNCLIRDNTLAAPDLALSSGSFALGILGVGENPGTPRRSQRVSAVGCAFVSNSVVSVEAENVTPVLSAGLLAAATVTGVTPEIGAANCTFIGPKTDGVCQVAQYGGVHSAELNVVNCLFLPDGDDTIADTVFYADVPRLVKARCCTFKNLFETYRPAGIDLADGIETDPTPVSWVPFLGQSEYPAPVVAVRMPGVRQTCDLATNSVDRPMTYAFRVRDTDTWLPLTPVSSTSIRADITAGVTDLLGGTFSEGSTTRGAVEELAEGAESARTLVIRRDPFTGGSVSPGYAQAVPVGSAPEELTAIPSGGSFVGWFAGSTMLSDSASYVPVLSAPETILTAKFGTPKVVLTFDLGGKGTFVDSGESTCTVEANVGDPFPDVPALTMAKGWHLVGWQGLPAVVPNADATYTATVITTSLRVFYVAPDGTGDGSSWAQATSDFAAAYANAGLYRGELRLKGGVYRLSASIPLLSNVSVVGGFAGSEEGEEPSDPESHPTVISGDKNGDNYWRIDGRDPAVAQRVPVWSGTVFNEPNPERTNEYWSAVSASASDDVAWAFQSGTSVVSNGVFRSLAFTGFAKGVLQMISLDEENLSSALTVRECRFLANNTTDDDNTSPLHLVDVSGVMVSNCVFTGNCRGVFASLKPSLTNVLSDLVFDCNHQVPLDVSFGANAGARPAVLLSDSAFRWNYADGVASAIRCVQGVCDGALLVSNASFEDNIVKRHGVVYAECSNGTANRWMELRRCKFLRNRAYGTAQYVIAFSAGVRLGYYAKAKIYDSYFADNVAKHLGSNVGTAAACILYDGQTSYSTIMNCTFERNLSVSGVQASSVAGTVVYGNIYGHHGIANSLFTENYATNLLDASRAGEFILSDLGGDLVLANCVLDNPAQDYRPVATVRTDRQMTLVLDRCSMSNFENEEAALRLISLNNAITDVSSKNALVRSRTLTGGNGAVARGIDLDSPFARSGAAVYADDRGYEAFRDAVNSPSKPWRYILPLGGAPMTDAQAAQHGLVEGVSMPLPDAFGSPRRVGRISYGPLVTPTPGMLLLVR